ncbi:MAG: class E sortase [Acidimicrobiales bacterium]
MSASRIIGGIGRGLISAGVIVLLFVVYQLWGTGIYEARAQNRLENEFAATLQSAGVIDEFENATLSEPEPTTTTEGPQLAAEQPVTTTTAAPSIYGPPPAQVEVGAALATMRIPKIGLEKVIVSGVDVESLKAGPGHYRGTPLPGQAGNSAIAGHRTTYGAPFYSVNELEPGDPIFVTTVQGSFEYRVTSLEIVDPSAVYVLDPTEDNRLTLTTCNPRYSARERLIVVAELVGEPADSNINSAVAVAEVELATEDFTDTETTDSTSATTETTLGAAAAPVTTQTTQAPSTAEIATGELEGGLSGISQSRWPVIFWGIIAALIWLGFWTLGRLWRRWPAYIIGTPIFLVALFVFFENFAALLPANV